MHHEALVCGSLRLTHMGVGDRLRRLGGLLANLGTDPGDRIAVIADNSVASFDLYLGVPAHRRVIVPLNTRWAEPELKAAIRDAGARVLFTDRAVGALGGEVAYVRTDHEYEALLHESPRMRLNAIEPTELAGLFYTGGTTGAAKGVMLTHGNLRANAATMRQIAPLRYDDVFLVMAPMFHAAGTTSVRYSMDAGVRQVVVAFDPAAVLDALEAEQVTHTLAVPTMLAALVAEQQVRPRDVSSLRVLMHGGAPITPALVDEVSHTFPGVELVHTYGTTETSPMVTALHGTTWSTAACVGHPVGCEVHIGPDGEVQVRGPNVMAGYWHRPEQTAAVLEDGWYRTGDIGRWDADRRLHILDRKDDMIVTGGENVYPTEVEAALCAHPAVAEAAVFGVSDHHWGQTVHAAVVLRHAVSPLHARLEAPVTMDVLVEHCRTLLAGYKVPRVIRFVDALPKSPAGKVMRRAL